MLRFQVSTCLWCLAASQFMWTRAAAGASHYSTIGFSTEWSTNEEMGKFWRTMLERRETVMLDVEDRTDGLKSVYWSTHCGSELWGQVNGENCFSGFDPHYRGISRNNMMIQQNLESSCMDEFEPFCINKAESPHLCFHCHNHPLHKLHFPTRAAVQLAAFAHEIRIFASLKEYKQYNELQHKTGELPMADKSFARYEFTDREKKDYAVFTGHILQWELKTNELTGNSFYWLLVQTLDDLEVDVVVDPRLIDEDCLPKKGGIIQGFFWLSGCLVPEDDAD